MMSMIPWLVLAIFTAAHVMSKWKTFRDEKRPVGFWDYVRVEAPAQTPLAILTSVGLGLVMWEQGVLNAVTAFTAGWSSNSLMDHFMKHTQTMLGETKA